MCQEGWWWIRAGGGCKNFKKREQTGSMVGCYEIGVWGWTGTHLQTVAQFSQYYAPTYLMIHSKSLFCNVVLRWVPISRQK